MFGILGRFTSAGRARHDLDRILSDNKTAEVADSELTLPWLLELFRWLRRPARVKTELGEVSRPVFFFQYLEANSEKKRRVARALQFFLSQSQALDLFCTSGLPAESSFLSELAGRCFDRFIPRPVNTQDLGSVLSFLFPYGHDAQWLRALEPETLNRFSELLRFEVPKDPLEVVRAEMEDAVLLLCAQIQVLGLDPRIRQRSAARALKDSPFFEIDTKGRFFVDLLRAGDREQVQKVLLQIDSLTTRCREELQNVHKHLEEFGVSVALVYQMERLERLLVRARVLMRILAEHERNPRLISELLAQLLEESLQLKSVRGLLSENFSLVSRKIAERSAETGDHYIARSRRGYFHLYFSAGGGGVLTVFTAFFKLAVEAWNRSFFVRGMVQSVNYAGSFLAIQMLGFTLGTKQPAMTAHALAERMKTLVDPKAAKELIEEILCLVRSQVVSVLGNITFVIPGVLIFDYIYRMKTGAPFLKEEEAVKIFEEHSIFGIAAFAGLVTGILLWLSSICAGWIDNWSTYRDIPAGLAKSRNLNRFFGKRLSLRFAAFYRRNLAGWAGNISLGFLLGLTPKFGKFLGLPLEVRHITLSSGALAFAGSSLGLKIFSQNYFWHAVAGMVVIGSLNVGVSFGLAFLVALRARRVPAIERGVVYRALFNRLKQDPLAWIRPPKAGLPEHSD